MNKLPVSQIFEIIGKMQGQVGLFVADITTGERLTINAEKVFPCASVIKIPMLALLLRDAEQGRVSLDAPCDIAPQNRVGGTGILRELDATFRPSLFELAKLMIMLSDNIATNQIIDVITLERHADFCAEMGLCDTRLMRKMMDFDAIKKGFNNYSSAQDMGNLLVNVAKGEFVSAEISATIHRMMAGQQLRSKLPAKVPAVDRYQFDAPLTAEANQVLVANKTGDLDCIQHDVGIFTLPDGRRYVIAMFTSDLASNEHGISAIAEVSAAVYHALKTA